MQMWQSWVEDEHDSIAYHASPRWKCDISEHPLRIKGGAQTWSIVAAFTQRRLSPALNRSSEISRFERNDAIKIRDRYNVLGTATYSS